MTDFTPIPSPLIHVGYVKTGSTWLQKHLTNSQELGFMEVVSRTTIWEELIRPTGLDYDASAISQEADAKLQECERLGLIPVISDERLSGNVAAGGYCSAYAADRLAGLFPAARILIVIREQRDLLRSMYSEYVRQGGACTIERYFFPPKGDKLPLFQLSFLEFDKLIRYYRTLFSPSRVLVVPFELLSGSPLDFVNRIATFCGTSQVGQMPTTPERKSKPALAVRFQRCTNLLFYRGPSNPAAPFRSELIRRVATKAGVSMPGYFQRREVRRMGQRIDRLVGERFVASNRSTQEFLTTDLESLGYAL